MSNNPNIENIRHSLSHILMQALERLYKATPGVGPSIENGFYHDFKSERQITTDNFGKIEKEMRKIISEKIDITKKNLPTKEAIDLLQEKNYLLTKELAEDLQSKGETKISFYTQDEFTNMCKGPHISNTGDINPSTFKLTKVAGAYWKGNEENEMIQRIYGIAFETKEELTKHQEMLKNAELRDHRKLGKELDLFTFSNLVGAGLPMFTPKGTIIRTELQNALIDISKKYDMQLVTVPHIAKKKLYEISGHADKFGDELLKVISHYDEFVMKPVNCPHHTQIFASKPRSYKDLPLRYMETTMQYRDEKPGEIGGLTRVRSICVDDGHIFCRIDQIKEEALNIAKIIEEFYSGLGMWGEHWVSLSVRDPKTPNAYIGTTEDWEKAESMLAEISGDLGLNAKKVEGEAAIYGPKLDYMFKDSLGRERQLATIQLDFAMPKRFELKYNDKDGQEKTPVMIHRAILGSYERFMALLIEHFAGAFPLWLSPTLVKIVSVGEGHIDFCHKLKQIFKDNGIRVEVDDSSETVGNKIRKAAGEKVPYMLVIGDKEVDSENLMVRDRGQRDTREISKTDLIKEIQNKIKNRK